MKARMRPLEATMRVARVPVRVLFFELTALVQSRAGDQELEESKKVETAWQAVLRCVRRIRSEIVQPLGPG